MAEGTAESSAVGEAAEMADHVETAVTVVSELLSVAVPGLSLIVKAAVTAGKTAVKQREESFCESISNFLFYEDTPALLSAIAAGLVGRFGDQLEKLTTCGVERLVSGYIIPCLLSEMSRHVHKQKSLNTQQKLKLLIRAPSCVSAPSVGVKLATKAPCRDPWTARELMIYTPIKVERDSGVFIYRHKHVAKTGTISSILSLFSGGIGGARVHHKYGIRTGDIDEIDEHYEAIDRPAGKCGGLFLCLYLCFMFFVLYYSCTVLVIV